MAIDVEKLIAPLTIFASITSVYLLFRDSNKNAETVKTAPNPASAGVTFPYLDSGVVTPQIQAGNQSSELGVADLVSFANPNTPSGQMPWATGPVYTTVVNGPSYNAVRENPASAFPIRGATAEQTSYLRFNTRPSGSLAQPIIDAASSANRGDDSYSCGCGGCDSDSTSCSGGFSPAYADGAGQTPLSSSRARQAQNGDLSSWLASVLGNAASFSQINGDGTTISDARSGRLQ